jgi:hypothetical protein
MMQFALWPPLPFATASMTIIMCCVLGLYFRLTVMARQRQRFHSPSSATAPTY